MDHSIVTKDTFKHRGSYVFGMAGICAISATIFALFADAPFLNLEFGIIAIGSTSFIFVGWELVRPPGVSEFLSGEAPGKTKVLVAKIGCLLLAASCGACFGGVVGLGEIAANYIGALAAHPVLTLATGG